MRGLCRTLLGSIVLAAVVLAGGCPADPAADPNSNESPPANDAVDEGGGNGGGGGGGGNPDTPSDGGDPTDGDEVDNFDGEFSGNSQKVTPYRDVLTREEAYHLLRRTSLGATEAQVEAAVEAGLAATVDDLLTRKSVPKSLQALAEAQEDRLFERWLVYLIESPNSLHERLAMFWHDRFATSRRVAQDWRQRNLPLQHMEMIRTNALGNYRDFLLELTLDPLMLLWLDGANSPKDNPNENYAREFWELFTLGRDVLYTEDDIREAARGFTGITLLYPHEADPRPIFDLYNHDETDKLIFPDRSDEQNHDYITITDLTLAQPEAPRYVARNLFRFFIHDEPSDATVQQLADLFVAEDFEIAPLVRALLVSQALFSPEARGAHISTPVEHYVGVARTLDMHIYSEQSQTDVLRWLADNLADAGQELMNPPGVNGWTEGAAWLEDQWVLRRAEAFERTMEYGPDKTEDLPYHLLPSRSRWAEREVRKEIVQAIAAAFHLALTEDEEDIYVEVLDQNGHQAFHLVEPDYQPRHVFEMIRLMAMDERVLAR